MMNSCSKRVIRSIIGLVLILTCIGCGGSDNAGETGQNRSSTDASNRKADATGGSDTSGDDGTGKDSMTDDSMANDTQTNGSSDRDTATTDDSARKDEISSTDSSSEETSSGGGECGDDHRKVGWIAKLETKSHGVEGTARIVDNCTIELSNFHYDGQGPAAYFYGAKDTNFSQGFQIEDELTRAYEGENVSLTLPSDQTLDDLGALSVWCVEFSVDFGSGTFGPASQ